MIYIVIILFVIVAILIATNIRIISQSDAVVIERLGAYLKTWTVGLHVKFPFIDKMTNKMSFKLASFIQVLVSCKHLYQSLFQ